MCSKKINNHLASNLRNTEEANNLFEMYPRVSSSWQFGNDLERHRSRKNKRMIDNVAFVMIIAIVSIIAIVMISLITTIMIMIMILYYCDACNSLYNTFIKHLVILFVLAEFHLILNIIAKFSLQRHDLHSTPLLYIAPERCYVCRLFY